jgi:hypothetical protein
MGRARILALLGIALFALPAGLLQAGAVSEYLAAGSGMASFTNNQPCPAMQAQLEWHPRVSDETVMTANFAGGQGSPLLLCVTGWRDSFMPDEVRGDPDHGIEGHRLNTPDAQRIDLYLSKADAHGVRSLVLHQITSLGDHLDFVGQVTDAV